MKYCAIPVAASVIALSGCLATTPPIQNSSGLSSKFVSPVLGREATENAWYVLVEKSITDGEYRVASISKNRQPISNDRQERIAFTDDLKGFAPDYTDYSFETYTDRGNYDERTVIMHCVSVPRKTDKYGPCNSEFGKLFIPMGVNKRYAAGGMSYDAHKSWEDPSNNTMRYVRSPLSVLEQAGALKQLAGLSRAQSTTATSPQSSPAVPAASSNALEVNNQWSVTISNELKLNAPLYVTLKQTGNVWEIAGLFEEPPKVSRSQKLELFMATRDFQQWTNYYGDMRTDCDKFEVRESEFNSVCTSSLAEKKTGMAIAGVFFGGSGKIPFAYTDSKVKAAINSIRPKQAMEVLAAFEQDVLSAKK